MARSRLYLSLFLIIGLFFTLGVSNQPTNNEGYKIRTVVIDAGHGGKDPGCSGRSSKEKNIALSITLKLGTMMEKKFPDIKVIYTRKTDEFITLYERAKIANRNNADLFISIHGNAIASRSIAGTETYVLGLHKSKANLDVAKRENEVILLEEDYNLHYDGFDPNAAEGHIIFSLLQNAYLDQSISFATKIEKQFSVNQKRKSKGVKQAGFIVLYKTSMPSVLVETGFLTNTVEEQYLKSEDGQNKIAEAIMSAFEEYKLEMESGEILKIDVPDVEIPIDTLIENVDESDLDHSVILFKVQIASGGKNKDLKKYPYSALNDIEVLVYNDVFKYTSGSFTYLNDAKAHQKRLRTRGFTDAFVVAYHNGKRISITEAKKLLNE